MGKYLNGYTPQRQRRRQASLHPAGLEPVGRGRQRLPGVQLQPQRERQARPLRLGPERVPHRRARAQRQLVHRPRVRGRASRSSSRSRPSRRTRPTRRRRGTRTDFPGLQAPRTPAFNEADVSDKPSWLRGHPSLTPAQISDIDAEYRKRAQSVEAVDDLIANDRGKALSATESPATPTSSSAPTTATTWATTG